MLLVSCGGTETWIPIAPNRPAVSRVHVQYLENPPQRPHIEIGIITPPAGEYETGSINDNGSIFDQPLKQ
jgi:hypothetical protein